MSHFRICSVVRMTLVVDNTPSAPARSYSRRSYRRRAPRRRRRTTRRRYSRYSRQGRSSMRRSNVYALNKFVLAQIDPFSEKVRGCKIPDSNTFPSTPIAVGDSIPYDVGAAGCTMAAFMPMLKNWGVVATTASGSTWTWPALYGGGRDSSKLASIDGSYSLYRPVAHGIKISCPYAPTTVTGNVHVAIAGSSTFGETTWTYPTSLADLQECMFYERYSLASLTQQPLTVVNKFLDCTATRYMDPSSDGIANSVDTGFQSNGWGAILICIEGCPASTTGLLSVENLLHTECITKQGTIDTSTPAQPYDPELLRQTSRVAGTVRSAYTEAERPTHVQEVMAALQQGASAVASNMYRSAVLPAVARAGGYAASYGLAGITNTFRRSVFGNGYRPHRLNGY